LSSGGDDNLKVSVGIEKRLGNINAPTVLNSRFNFRQFWDGRAKDLETQIEGPIHSGIEMDTNWAVVIERLQQDKYYVKKFTQLYEDGITSSNIKHAIADFERALTTPNSTFDRYLQGDTNALTETQKYGYERFKQLGCISCHQGVNIGGNMYHKIGIIHDYFADRGDISDVDYGLFNITNNERDKFKFKVPSLRNVILTAPYFHDGTSETLKDAIEKMAYYQLGERISQNDTLAIETFVASLTGEIDLTFITKDM